MGEELRPPADRWIAEVAAAQHGVVAAYQLASLGLGKDAVWSRARAGRLHPVHRGVYAVGHTRLTARGRLWAAVLACGGPGAAVVSHRCAAALWDLRPMPAIPEVTTLRHGAGVAGVRVHRSRTIDPRRDVTVGEDGLPRTTVARTLADLAGVVPLHHLMRACREAERLRLLDVAALHDELTRMRGRRGARALRAALEQLALTPAAETRSPLEDRLVELVARSGLPRPRVNGLVEGFEVDLHWPAARVVAEADGRETHLTRPAFEADRERDAVLQVAGWKVVRFTDRQLRRRPDHVVATLRGLLAA